MRLSVRWNVGSKFLFNEWKNLFTFRYLKEDAIAGLTVACVAIPLSLAIALASDVEPGVGLITAIIAGIVCALFGGSTFSVSGPAAAMAVLIATTVERFGLPGLLVVGLGCGILQFLFGALGFGKIVRFVPLPVIAGFTAGIGAIILIGQLPRALGLPPPDQNHVIDVVKHLSELAHHASPQVLLLATLTVAIAKLLPKAAPKLPAPLIAVLIPTLIVQIFSLQIPLVGNMPSELPSPKFPVIPTEGWPELLAATLTVFALASLETLLSAAAVDKIAGQERHDPNQELIGQGIGNVIVALFGGIPVTAVIARSALNVASGARTRRSPIIHSIVLLCAVYFFSSYVAIIPIAALAGLLIAIALGMINYKEFLNLWKQSQSEGFVYLATFFAIVLIDLIAGFQIGVICAIGIAVIRLGQTNIRGQLTEYASLRRISLSGPLTFLSTNKFERLSHEIDSQPSSVKLLLDLSGVTQLDSTGAEMFWNLIENAKKKGIAVSLKGLSERNYSSLKSTDAYDVLDSLIIYSETDLNSNNTEIDLNEARTRLINGAKEFQSVKLPHYEALFKHLADKGQSPHTFFITCADSRVNPNLITSTEPGELFIARNVGNLVPPYTPEGSAEAAALEYAVCALKVKLIVICGHLKCGAMNAICNGIDANQFPLVTTWLHEPSEAWKKAGIQFHPDELVKLNLRKQLDHLRTYPFVVEAIKEKRLELQGWVFDVSSGTVITWDETTGVFKNISEVKLNGQNGHITALTPESQN